MEYDGKDLIDLGYEPGKHFAEMLKVANNMAEHEIPHARILEALDEMYEDANFVPETIPLREVDAFGGYNAYLDPGETEYEEKNNKAVYETMDQLIRTPTLVDGAVLPDACPAGPLGTIPVGGLAVAENAIHPGMHSADICCSMFLTTFDLEGNPENAKKVLDAGQAGATHFGYGGRKDMGMGRHNDIMQRAQENRFLASVKMFKAMDEHLGTQGDGNHFFYVGYKESTGELTLVTHHGSRSPGALLYKEGMKIAEQFRQKLSPDTLKQNAWIPFDTDEGQWYWEALQIIRDWTRYNHMRIHDEIWEALGQPRQTDRYWNEHNFVFKKGDHFYHAKGSTPMWDNYAPHDYLVDDRRIIPLNMAEPILIGLRRGDEAHGFAPHGAGRYMSRTAFNKLNAHKTPEQIMVEQTGDLDIRFYSGTPDMSELPGAYKNASAVQRQIKDFDLAKIVDRIQPLGCMMAGELPKPWLNKKGKRR